MVVMMLGYCSHGLCTLPNMVINAKIMRKIIHINILRKSEKNQEKMKRQMEIIVNNVGALFTWYMHISQYGN